MPPLPHGTANAHAAPPELQGELPALLRLARSVLRSDDLAWDAVQETLLRTWSRTPQSLGPASRGPLRHLTFHTSLQLLRGRRRRLQREEQAAARAPEETPLETLEREELRAALRGALATLPPPQRQVLELHYFEEADYGRIAADLAVAPGTVGSRLHRARGALRRRLVAQGAAPR